MKKISEILGKNIISLYEGKRIGIIENVAFDKKLKRLKSFIVYDEDSDDLDRLFVPSGGVKIEGENAVMIKNLEKVVEDTKNMYSKKNPMNASVYNLSGNLLGKVTEILINDDKKDIHSLVLNDGAEIMQAQIVSGDFKTIVVQLPGEELPVLTSPKKKKTADSISNEVENIDLIKTKISETTAKSEIKAVKISKLAENASDLMDTSMNIPVAENFPSEVQAPEPKDEALNTIQEILEEKITLNSFSKNSIEKSEPLIYDSDTEEVYVNDAEEIEEVQKEIQEEIYLNSENEPSDEIPLNLRRCSAYFGFLIGRRVEYDIYNARKEKIVKRNTIITNKTLDICKKWGKLIILARSSVR